MERLSVLKNIITILKKKDIKLSKILIQKVIFFIKELYPNHGFGYRFEMYKYGPYSHELSSDLDILKIQGEIDIKGNEILINNDNDVIDNDRLTSFVANTLLPLFKDNDDFNTIELLGTVLYCIKALQENGLELNKESVIQEVKGWKGTKYDDTDIGEAHNRVINLVDSGWLLVDS